MNFFQFRSDLYSSVVSHYVSKGCILPRWALGLRTILFPLEMLGHFLSRPNHYDVLTDTYIIHGIRYHGEVLRTFAAPEEEGLYRFKRNGELVSIERVILPIPGQEVSQ